MIPCQNSRTSLAQTLALLICVTTLASVYAEVRLPKILDSGMVIQRNARVNIWGWADPGESISVRGDWMDRPVQTTANANGDWSASIRTGQYDKPHSLTISGRNTIELTDVLFGEVWIGSGQSNMEMPLAAVSNAYTGIENAESEIAAAHFPLIRLFQVGNYSSKEPLDDVESGIIMYGIPPADCQWKPCTPETIPHFSSTAYFFAAELHRQLGVPIGIIDASWGGTSAETWTPLSGLQSLDGYDKEIEEALQLPQKADQKIPTRLYNGMIHPLRNFRIKGVIWYQGESNRRRADQYHALFSTMITEWRSAFGYTFPFYFTQIAPYNYGETNAAFLREAQAKTMSLRKTGMAVTVDIGDADDIHPKNKREVGRRLALWALAKDYRKRVDYSGPRLRKHRFDESRVVLTFDHARDGLVTKDGEAPRYFEIAGPDKVFHTATAVIEGNKVIASSPSVPYPRAVRFAFSNLAAPNLINRAGLPAHPFRTDDWK